MKKDHTGRLHAGDNLSMEDKNGYNGRKWNAMTMEILSDRIFKTLNK